MGIECPETPNNLEKTNDYCKLYYTVRFKLDILRKKTAISVRKSKQIPVE